MTALKCLHANGLAPGAWIAVALAPWGWVLGIANFAFLSGEGEAKGIGRVTGIQVALLLVAAPASAVVLALWVARAGRRSGRSAVVVSGFGLLLLATLVLALLLGWIGLVVFAVVTVLAFIEARCRGPSEEVASRVGDRFDAITRGHGPCRMGNGGKNDGVGLQIVTRFGGEFRHETDQGSR